MGVGLSGASGCGAPDTRPQPPSGLLRGPALVNPPSDHRVPPCPPKLAQAATLSVHTGLSYTPAGSAWSEGRTVTAKLSPSSLQRPPWPSSTSAPRTRDTCGPEQWGQGPPPEGTAVLQLLNPSAPQCSIPGEWLSRRCGDWPGRWHPRAPGVCCQSGQAQRRSGLRQWPGTPAAGTWWPVGCEAQGDTQGAPARSPGLGAGPPEASRPTWNHWLPAAAGLPRPGGGDCPRCPGQAVSSRHCRGGPAQGLQQTRPGRRRKVCISHTHASTAEKGLPRAGPRAGRRSSPGPGPAPRWTARRPAPWPAPAASARTSESGRR